jgi:NAD(P)-dependent dehydrogenase (short-subunit alcohol dehydrogenase family)
MSRVAVVTGASRGIGYAVAAKLVASGYFVIGTTRTLADTQQIGDVSGPFCAGRLEWLPLDVRSLEGVEAFAKALGRLSDHVDILVNNAGVIGTERTVEEECVAEWDDIVATNLRGAFLVSKVMIPFLRRSSSGVIVNVSGGLGSFFSGMPGGMHSGYRISKVGLNALTVILAEELRVGGISVIAVDPGWVRTRLGGVDAPRGAEDAADDIISAAMHSEFSGALVRFGTPVPW